ncbi:MAG TPA: hypothetical protein VFG76_04815 [Candidatus Polarisedimenticolia bacterium]|nr:hypothetical protein [Candidatus Polarisedimenticolia bacterium]
MTSLLAGMRGKTLAVGLFGLGLTAIGAVFGPDQFFRSYLFAYMFWLGVALGCLAIVMIQHLTGGAWGLITRRILESGARTLPMMALLFVPVVVGLSSLYMWARDDEVARDEILRHKAPYLNIGFFLARAAVYFAVWSTLALVLSRWSRAQDETGDARLVRKFQMLSAGGLLLFVLTMTFASVDWVMSLEPHWFSTIYGVLLMAGQAVSALCFAIAMVILLSRHKPLSEVVTAGHLHDLGKLLFAFVMVWAYFALSQFLIIWSGNLPEEIPWYLRRMRGGWEWLGLAIILLHFVLPFLLLLPRRVKRSPTGLLRVALLVFLMRLVDLYWMMAPAHETGGWRAHWMDLSAPIGVGGIWLFLFLRQVERFPLLPLRDPSLGEALVPAHE